MEVKEMENGRLEGKNEERKKKTEGWKKLGAMSVERRSVNKSNNLGI